MIRSNGVLMGLPLLDSEAYVEVLLLVTLNPIYD